MLKPDTGRHRRMHPGAAEQHVQSFFAASFIYRPEIHQHPPRYVEPIADAHDDDISFVTLDIFQVLHDKTGELVVLRAVVRLFQLSGKISVCCRYFLQRIFDRMLLLLEGRASGNRKMAI